MGELRLGDTIDDFCAKCKRLTNHNIVSLVADAPAKVRCCSCYRDHDYEHAIVPPTKKELRAMELLKNAAAEETKPN